MSRELRGWRIQLMNTVDWQSFLRLRATCIELFDQSRFCNKQWYFWLDTKGTREEVMLIKHVYAPYECEQYTCGDALCQRTDHTRLVTTRPRILKTVPLNEQVMRQVLRTRRKTLRSAFASSLSMYDSLLGNLASQRKRLERCAHDLDVFEKIEDRVPKKRRFARIDFHLEDF